MCLPENAKNQIEEQTRTQCAYPVRYILCGVYYSSKPKHDHGASATTIFNCLIFIQIIELIYLMKIKLIKKSQSKTATNNNNVNISKSSSALDAVGGWRLFKFCIR